MMEQIHATKEKLMHWLYGDQDIKPEASGLPPEVRMSFHRLRNELAILQRLTEKMKWQDDE